MFSIRRFERLPVTRVTAPKSVLAMLRFAAPALGFDCATTVAPAFNSGRRGVDLWHRQQV